MQTHWIKREGEDELLLFVLGWGADPHAVEHIRPDGYDSLAVFDYRVREPLSSSLNSEYGRIHLFAWSFGVWAAEQIATELDLYQAVALNGTPLPINDRYGIPERAFSVTLRGIPRSGCEGFNLRAYGDSFGDWPPISTNARSKNAARNWPFWVNRPGNLTGPQSAGARP